jgi:hypothetical protein
MVIVTLVGVELAKEGMEFTYLGANNECRNCQLKTVCFNLKSGHSYRITKLRDKRHNCTVHEGQVVVVEVEELPLAGMTDQPIAEGASVKLKKTNCRNLSCNSYDVCTNPVIQQDRAYVVCKSLGKVDCPKGFALFRVDVKE